MPPRRKKRRTGDAIMKQRMGLRGWNGSRPFHEWSKTLVTKTIGEGHNPGTTTGATFVMLCNGWNDPIGTLGTLVAGTGSLTENRHPVRHSTAISVGYKNVQVLSWNAKIEVNWLTANSPTMDFRIGYTFSEDNTSEVVLGSGATGRIERMEFLTNPRWTTKKFNATAGVDEVPKTTSVFINVPNVFKYCQNIAAGDGLIEANNGNVSHLIADSSNSSNTPAIQLWCRVVIFTDSGLAMPVDSLHVTVSVTQRVKIMRDKIGTENMDGGEVDTHA